MLGAGSASVAQAASAADIDLARDNPLADATIESVTLRLTGVADVELAELDAKAIADIVQSDDRVLIDRSGWFLDSLDWLISEYPPHFFITLASGEELTVSTNGSLGSPSGSLVILKPDHETYEYYELSDEEYETFVETYKNVSLVAIDSVPVTVKPFEDLTPDQLVKVTRTNDWNDYSGVEHTLSEEQIESLIQTLNKLEIQPATIDQDPPELYDGTYKDFELWFENGERIAVGEYHNAPISDGDDGFSDETHALAWIDGATFECDQQSADELYYDYQEWSPTYKKQYLNTRNASEHPFESLTAGEIRAIKVGPNDAYSTTEYLASLDLAEEVVDVLRQLKISQTNKVEGQPSSVERVQQDWGKEENQLIIVLSNDELFYLRTSDGNILLNSVEYEQDDGVTQAYVQLYEDAVASVKELAAQTN